MRFQHVDKAVHMTLYDVVSCNVSFKYGLNGWGETLASGVDIKVKLKMP